MTQKKKQPRAKVYVWPLLNDEDKLTIEDQCIAAGYDAKRWVRVGRVLCWEISNG